MVWIQSARLNKCAEGYLQISIDIGINTGRRYAGNARFVGPIGGNASKSKKGQGVKPKLKPCC
jgi:hypothetical protein